MDRLPQDDHDDDCPTRETGEDFDCICGALEDGLEDDDPIEIEED